MSPFFTDQRGRRSRLYLQVAVAIALAVSVTLLGASRASSDSTPTKNPTAAVDATGIGTIAWINTTRAFSSNDMWATAEPMNGTSHYLKFSGYGFAVPAGSTITGVAVSIERQASGTASLTDASLKLVNAAGTITGTDHADTVTTYSHGVDSVANYGSSSDLWGLTLTPTDVNDADFGVAFASKYVSGVTTNQTEVDVATMTVYYTPGGTPPTNTALPTISGTAQVGQTLTGTSGTWSGSPPITYTYQWRQCDSAGNTCANISGATAATYVVASGDVGHTIRVRVTATNSFGNGTADSTQTAVVTGGGSTSAGPNNPTAAVDATGIGTIAWINTTRAFSSNNLWATAEPMNGTSHYLKLSGYGFAVPAGSTITGVGVSVERQASGTASLTDASLKLVNAAGTITGTDHADTVTTYSHGVDSVANYGSSSDLWGLTLTPTDVNDADFGVAFASKYVSGVTTNQTEVDVVTMTVYYTTGGGGTPPSNTAVPAVSGFARVSGIEHATSGTWTGTAPISYAYQWRRCDSAGANCVDISGATLPDYDVVSADQSHTLRARVTASNTAGNATADSAQTAVVGAAATSWTASNYTYSTFLNPPSAPFSAFVGAWQDPTTKDLWMAFSQASGTYSANTPQWVKDRGVIPGTGRDFWNLTSTTEYWKSTNHGTSWNVALPVNNTTDLAKTWNPATPDCPNTGTPTGQNCNSADQLSAFFPQANIQLANGDIIRRVNGEDIKYDTAVKVTAFIQRLTPGAGHVWGAPEYLLDPTTCSCTYQISRIRRLRDGRLIALGQKWDAYNPKGSTVHLLLMVGDSTGHNWTSALTSQPEAFAENEWDVAELPNGDLMAVFRTSDSCSPIPPGCNRRQGLLRKSGSTWSLASADVKTPPFGHSGHPELIETSAGSVLYLATNDTLSTPQKGIWYLSNANAQSDSTSWTKLPFSVGGTGCDATINCSTQYYPRSFEDCTAGICTIYVFSHVGGDDPYTPDPNESIILQKFRLN